MTSKNAYWVAALVAIVSATLSSCGGSNTDEGKASDQMSEEQAQSEQYDAKLSEHLALFAALPSSAENTANPGTEAKIKLGHVLYYDNRLSKDQTQSCNSCHNLSSYGVDNLPTSPGDAGKNGDRNSPTVLNAALHATQFWDGRAADVEEQAGMPVMNPVEMAIPDEAFLMKRLREVPMYQELFAAAYPEEKDPFTYTNLRHAIASFERQLITPSRFDEYLQGKKDALTLQEKKGMLSFTLIGCTTCHNGALLGGNQMQKFGVHKPYWEATGSAHRDLGLMSQTNDSLDLYLFKVPSLRNISKTGPYFHDGSVADLKEAVRIMADVQLNYQMNGEEVKNVVAFLEALTGDIDAAYKQNPVAAATQ